MYGHKSQDRKFLSKLRKGDKVYITNPDKTSYIFGLGIVVGELKEDTQGTDIKVRLLTGPSSKGIVEYWWYPMSHKGTISLWKAGA